MHLDLDHLFAGLPAAERAHAEQWIEYNLTMLSLMPSEQRYEEYARAQIGMVHYARLMEESTPSMEIPAFELEAERRSG